MKRHHRIEIIETDQEVRAYIKNLNTQKYLTIQLDRSQFNSRDEMIGELFSGSLPNIRDCYDSDAWVNDVMEQKD